MVPQFLLSKNLPNSPINKYTAPERRNLSDTNSRFLFLLALCVIRPRETLFYRLGRGTHTHAGGGMALRPIRVACVKGGTEIKWED